MITFNLSTIVMLLASLTILFSASAVAQTQPAAPLATNQPAGITYQAILDGSKPIQGSITGVSAANGTGVTFNIEFRGFPDGLGPFAYHIHVDPVADGNCTMANGHLRPFDGPNDTAPCDTSRPELCQVGDLSGKHGKITNETLTNGNKFLATYTDPYVSAIEGSEAFFGNRSIVIHQYNSTRVNCANFVLQGQAPSNPGGTSEPSMSTSAGAPGGTSGGTATGTGTASSQTGSATGSGAGTSPSPSTFTNGGDGRVARGNSWFGLALLGIVVMFAF